jgi:hypothetical protein
MVLFFLGQLLVLVRMLYGVITLVNGRLLRHLRQVRLSVLLISLIGSGVETRACSPKPCGT